MAHYVESPATFISAEALSAFRRVKFTAAARTVEYADEGDEAIGITEHSCASGDPVSVRLIQHASTFKAVCAASSCSVGDALYPAVDGKLNTTKLFGSEKYYALVAGTAAGDVIEVSKVPPSRCNLVASSVAASSAISNTITETAFSNGSKTLSGENLLAGDVIHVIAQGIATSTNSTDTLNVKLYLGTEEIVATGAVDVANNDIFFIDAWITVRTAGGSATLVSSGTVALGAEGTAAAEPFKKASATEDLSGDVDVAVKATWSVASASNSVRLDQFIVLVHKA